MDDISNKIGIIGCGMIGSIHIENLINILGRENIAIFDNSKDNLEIIANKYNITNTFYELQSFINSSNIDSVIISTPPNTHVPYAIQCIQANKNVLIEKPISSNTDDLEELEKNLNLNPDLIIMDCSARHSRLQPKFAYIKEIIKNNDFGEIYFIHHNVLNRGIRPGIEYNSSAKWFLQKEKSGGGGFIDWGVYDLAFHLGIMDDNIDLITYISSFYSGFDNHSKNNKMFTVEEHSIAMLKFAGYNYFYERSSNVHNYSKNETRIYGSKAGLKFNYLAAEDNLIELYRLDKQEKPICELINLDLVGYNGYTSDHFEMIKHFIDCTRKAATPILPIATSIKILKLLYKIYGNEIKKF